MRELEATLIATMCICVSASAQELTITGRVAGSDGAPLSMAFVALDSSNIICQVDSTGHYVLVVPASIAHGQSDKLMAMARGHINSEVPVTLAGISIVRDMVLQVDTMPEHRRAHPTLSDGETVKSATNITITGRVTDSAGGPIPGASLRLDPGGFGANADDSGRYVMVVPERLSQQRVLISARLMGFTQSSDSTPLNGKRVIRDFVLDKPIYRGAAAQLDSAVVRVAQLNDLRAGPHDRHEREIRIHTDGGLGIPYDLYVFRERGGKASGEYIRYYHARNPEEIISGSRKGNRYFRRTCRKVVFGELFACHVKLMREPDWKALWNTLDSLDIWNIADEGTLQLRWSIVMDGSTLTVDLWDGHVFKVWAHTLGVENHAERSAKLIAVSSVLEQIDLLIPPTTDRETAAP